MKTKNTLITAAAMFATLGLHAAPSINIDTVLVGNANNVADTRTSTQGGTPNIGAVSYDYYIGTTGVTAGQYATFLNAVATNDNSLGLYNANMYSNANGCGIQQLGNATDGYTYVASKGDNMPVNFVSVYDAMRFCNWVTSGNTEVGIYMFNGQVNDISLVVRNDAAWQAGGVAIASLDEWYKAAFYNGSTGQYSTYANGKDTITTAEANFNNAVGAITDVFTYETTSFYGVLDMSGNVYEWTETISSGSNVYRRGGSFSSTASILASSSNNSSVATYEGDGFGFRVSSLTPIPEPGTYAAIFGTIAFALTAYRKRSITPKK